MIKYALHWRYEVQVFKSQCLPAVSSLKLCRSLLFLIYHSTFCSSAAAGLCACLVYLCCPAGNSKDSSAASLNPAGDRVAFPG